MTDAQTLTETPAAPDAASTATDAINQLKARADETLAQELHAIADAAGRESGESVGLRLKRKSTLDDLVGATAWLARDLVDTLLKVAAGTDPHAVMSSDLAARIREAEIRLELLWEMSR